MEGSVLSFLKAERKVSPTEPLVYILRTLYLKHYIHLTFDQ